jgi:hypothetical protein
VLSAFIVRRPVVPLNMTIKTFLLAVAACGVSFSPFDADAFDEKVAETIRAQAAKKGISYQK